MTAARGLLDRGCLLFATGGYISYIPVTLTGGRKWTGAGFLGTVAGAALLPLMPRGPVSFSVFLAAAFAAACWICGRAERILGGHDDSRIVLDEIVGYWTAVAFLPWTPRALLAAFVLFRIFDAMKPYPVNKLEKLPGGLGCVADDVGAGLCANAVVQAFYWSRPEWLA